MEVGKSTVLRIDWFPRLVLNNGRKCNFSLECPIPFMFESKGICDGPCDSEEEGIVSPGSPVTVTASCLTGGNWPAGLLTQPGGRGSCTDNYKSSNLTQHLYEQFDVPSYFTLLTQTLLTPLRSPVRSMYLCYSACSRK